MNEDKIQNFYKKWLNAEKKSNELTKALQALEKEAKKFTNTDITATSSMSDGVAIVWEDFDIWGQGIFYMPCNFINACIEKGCICDNY